MEPLISLIIPVYNVEEYLDYCISSVRKQLYNNLEIILVNDGSTDNSGKMCDEYARMDDRVKVIHKENGGLSSARNTGMKFMTGQYFSFVDSDDYVRIDYISKLYAYIKEDNTDIVMCSAKKVIGEEDYNIVLDNVVSHNIFDSDTAKMKMLSRQIPMYSPGKLYQARLAKKMMFPEGKLFEDIPTTWNVIKCVDSITYIEDKLYFYRQRVGSIVNAKFKAGRMDGVYFIEEIINEISEKDSLYNIAVAHYFYCIIDNYSLVTEEFYKEKDYLKECIKAHRICVLKDRRVQKSLRGMAFISCISPDLVRILGKVYKKYNYIKWKTKNVHTNK